MEKIDLTLEVKLYSVCIVAVKSINDKIEVMLSNLGISIVSRIIHISGIAVMLHSAILGILKEEVGEVKRDLFGVLNNRLHIVYVIHAE